MDFFKSLLGATTSVSLPAALHSDHSLSTTQTKTISALTSCRAAPSTSWWTSWGSNSITDGSSSADNNFVTNLRRRAPISVAFIPLQGCTQRQAQEARDTFFTYTNQMGGGDMVVRPPRYRRSGSFSSSAPHLSLEEQERNADLGADILVAVLPPVLHRGQLSTKTDAELHLGCVEIGEHRLQFLTHSVDDHAPVDVQSVVTQRAFYHLWKLLENLLKARYDAHIVAYPYDVPPLEIAGLERCISTLSMKEKEVEQMSPLEKQTSSSSFTMLFKERSTSLPVLPTTIISGTPDNGLASPSSSSSSSSHQPTTIQEERPPSPRPSSALHSGVVTVTQPSFARYRIGAGRGGTVVIPDGLGLDDGHGQSYFQVQFVPLDDTTERDLMMVEHSFFSQTAALGGTGIRRISKSEPREDRSNRYGNVPESHGGVEQSGKDLTAGASCLVIGVRHVGGRVQPATSFPGIDVLLHFGQMEWGPTSSSFTSKYIQFVTIETDDGSAIPGATASSAPGMAAPGGVAPRTFSVWKEKVDVANAMTMDAMSNIWEHLLKHQSRIPMTSTETEAIKDLRRSKAELEDSITAMLSVPQKVSPYV